MAIKGRTKTQVCEVTGDEFTLTSQHLDAYEYFDLPLPTVCPEERFRLQLSFRNDHRLFLRTCSQTDKPIVSIFGAQAPFPVVSNEYWRSDDYNPLLFGRNFDFNQLFVEQLLALWWTVPRPATSTRGELNCEGTHLAFDLRNCSFVFHARDCTDCLYCVGIWHSEKCVDCYNVRASSRCYECVHCNNCRDVYWSTMATNCESCWFVSNCSNCKYCLFCSNLDGKEYYVKNRPVTPEEFSEAVRRAEFLARSNAERAKEEFGLFLLDQPLPDFFSDLPEETSGNYLSHCRKSYNSYECFNSIDLLDCNQLHNATNCLEGFGFGDGLIDSAQFVSVGSHARNIVNCIECWNDVSDLAYCNYCENSHHLLACIGLRNREYCIFNKQYSKEEYTTKRAAIVAFLKERGIWGKFFPAQFSGLAYNQSAAILYMPLAHVTAKMMGFRWDESPPLTPAELLSGSDLPADQQFKAVPNTTATLPLSLAGKGCFICEISGMPFAVLPQELRLYEALGVPPPARCFEQRHAERVRSISGRKLIVCKSQTGEEIVSPFGKDTLRPVLARKAWNKLQLQ